MKSFNNYERLIVLKNAIFVVKNLKVFHVNIYLDNIKY